MVQLMPMNEGEFQAYRQVAIAQVACDHVKAGTWAPEAALQLAEQTYQHLLPDGLASPNQYLLMIADELSGRKVGTLWFAVRDEGAGPEAFVYDVRIFEEFRRRHYATHAFRALERYARTLGLTTIYLQFLGENFAARTMYEKLGYVATHILMCKTLRPPDG
jgi:RimJ/RimL family protein N-acetyltransferase